ncbi:MAG: peptidylprolyl isomerase [Paludibacteraceae bacterium]|nr:peptidylprolyl isomerase [Paludibacteraceae bacterium]
MGKRRLFAGLSAVLTVMGACAQTVVTIGDEPIDRSLFDYYYSKNNTHVSGTELSPADYLDMFVNFRLKVHAAYAEGMDREPGFQEEFDGYRAQVAAGYMTDSTAVQSYVKEAYEHLKEEVDVCHILFSIDRQGGDEEALERARKIRAALTPENFSSVADAVSDDPSKHTNHGAIGYITGGMVVFPFEQAAFNTPVGSISEPVRTQFGYHLIYVRDRRPASGEVLLAHIFKTMQRYATDAQIDSMRQAVDSLYQLALARPDDFAELAKANSDDQQNAQQGGVLPWIGIGRTNPYFEKAVFAMKDSGEIIKIEAPYGWHIVKLLGHRNAPAFEEVKPQLEMRVRMDDRSRLIEQSFIDGLKRDYHFQWGRGDTLATYADEVLMRSDLHEFVVNNLCGPDSVDQFVAFALRDYEDRHLETKYPEFGRLMQEYRDGILLFNISNREVWEPATRDTLGLERYFETHKENYAWPTPHYTGLVIYCADKSTFKRAKRIARTTGEPYLKTTLLNHFNADGKELVRIEEGRFEPGVNAVVDHEKYGQDAKPMPEGYPYAFLSTGSYSKYPESYHAIQGAVISDFQDDLERQWLQRLRAQYPVVIDPAFRESLKH